MFGGEFRIDDETFQVSGFQPDFVSFDEGFEASLGTGAHDLSRKFMSGEGFVAGGGEGFKAGFHCGNGSIGDHRGKSTGFISHHEIERRLVGDRMGAVVVGEFSMGDRFGPRCGIIAAKDTKVGFDFLIDPFRFAVRLWVIGGGEREIVVEESSELSSEGRCKLRTTIGDDLIKKSEVEEDLVKKEGCDPFGGDGFLGRAKNYPLSKPMVYHDHERVKAHGGREVGDKVARDLLEGAGGEGFNRRQGGYGGVCVGLILLAKGTAFDITADKRGEAGPPEFGGDQLTRFEEAGVAGGFMVMAPCKDGATERIIGRYVDTTFVCEDAGLDLPVSETGGGRGDRPQRQTQCGGRGRCRDRKSTRLNSSHVD